jgi:hypothetical protein
MLNEVLNIYLGRISTEPAMLVFLVLGVTLLAWAELSARNGRQ